MIVVPLLAMVFLAGTVNGATGMGFGILTAVGLSFVTDVRHAVVLLALTAPVVSGLQLRRHRGQAIDGLGRVRAIAIGALAGVPIGAWLLGWVDERALALLLAVVTLVFVAANITPRRMTVSGRAERFASPLVGVMAGIANGAIGVSGPILGSYLLSLRLGAAAFAFTISALFVAMGLVRLVSIGVLGQLDTTIILTGLALLVPAMAGQQLGFALQDRVSRETFRRLVLVALTVASVNLLARAAAG